MLARTKHHALALAITMGTLAGACGPAATPPDMPSGGVPTDAHTTPDPTGATPGETPAADTKAPDASHAKSTPLRATEMAAELKKIGIDLAKIPTLEKLPLAQKKKVMPLLQKALGYDACTGCHVEGDLKQETRNMRVAREMWRHFVVPLRTEGGGTLFCDSCHAGKEQVLARADRKAVEAFMSSDYEHKLSQASKADMECSTCHGDAMEVKIIEKLWKIAK